MEQTEIRSEVIRNALALNETGLSVGKSGNVSARSAKGFLITPSGVAYESLAAKDIVEVGPRGVFQGDLLPSSEWQFHQAIYEGRPDVNAIVHAHPTYSTALACQRREIPAFHYMVAVAGGKNIRCAQYATFGTAALADSILRALKDRKACLMGNHGIIAVGESLAQAMALAVEVENLAHQYWCCLQSGEPVILSDSEMERVIEKFKTYGKQPDPLNKG